MIFWEKSGQHKLAILRSPLFVAVLAFKVAAAPFFASDAFVRAAEFVNRFVDGGFANPYLASVQAGMAGVFPYPAFMAFLLAVPRVLLGPFFADPNHALVSAFIFRIPILAADIILFVILARWLKNEQRRVLLYYWCSPILFFIGYVLGGFDVIPIMLVFASLFLLFKEKYAAALFVLGLSVAAKTGIAIVLPFVAVYLVREQLPWKRIAALLALPVAVYAAMNAPFFMDIGTLRAFWSSSSASLLDFRYGLDNGPTIYFVPVAYLMLFAASLMFRRFNRDVFLMFLGFAFGIITLLTPPLAGWYVWIIPFFVYFYIKSEDTSPMPFVLLNVAYFAYFAAIPDSPLWTSLRNDTGFSLYGFMGRYVSHPEIAVNILFSLLQGMLLLVIVWVYRRGIQNSLSHKMKYQPYFIGLAGDSGSGKSVLTDLLRALFRKTDTLEIAGDDMHKWERGDVNWHLYTHLDPKANRLHDDIRQAHALASGRPVSRRMYDHRTGRFTDPKRLPNKRVVIFQGLHALYLNKMRELLDLKIFVAPNEELRTHWKVRRDVQERGYPTERVLQQLTQRESDSAQYIRRQEEHADIVISLMNDEPIADPASESVRLFLRMDADAAIPVDPLLYELQNARDLAHSHRFEDDRQHIEFRGSIDAEQIDAIAYALIPELWDITGTDPEWEAGYNGLIQLFVGYVIFTKLKNTYGA